jgi:hypothetical protein
MKKKIKNLLATSTGALVGAYALGTISDMPGMPAQGKQAASIGMTGLSLAPLGSMMDIAGGMFDTGSKKKGGKKSII